MSLLPWGVLKRAIKGRLAKTTMGVPFVPRYELAVWTASVLQPDLVCYFPDEHSAMEGFAKVEAAIKQDGLANPWNILMEDQTRLYLAPFCRLGKMQEDTIRGHRDAFKELEERQVKLDDAYATMIEAEGSYPRARSVRLGDDEAVLLACREALKEFTRERVPLDWAMTKRCFWLAARR